MSSQQLINGAESRIRPRESIEGTDRPVPALIEQTKTLSDELEAAIKKLPMDENYGRRCNELYKAYNLKRYEMTHQYDNRNEASPRRNAKN